MPRIVSNIVDVYVFRLRPAPPSDSPSCQVLQLLRAPALSVGGTWQSVHGGIEPGESAVAAALREMKEETGLTPIRFWQLEHVNTFFIARSDEIHLCPSFAAEVDFAASQALRICDEHTASRWLPIREAEPAFLWPGQRSAIREILEVIFAAAPAERLLRVVDTHPTES